jgi:hypothetical protein
MRSIIDAFFVEIGQKPRVIMEADDTAAIRRIVESGFGYSILPEYALRDLPANLRVFRVPGRRIVRYQALAMVRTEHPRALTLSIAKFLELGQLSQPCIVIQWAAAIRYPSPSDFSCARPGNSRCIPATKDPSSAACLNVSLRVLAASAGSTSIAVPASGRAD